MERLDPGDFPLGHDEACAADLQAVCDNRMLGRHEVSWLARALAGAIRPSRDRPLWDLAHAVATLGLDGRAFVDLALDPALATATGLQDRLAAHPASDGRGLALAQPRPWRIGWAGLARVLALAEFLLTADECADFADLIAEIGDGIPSAEAADFARRLSSRLARYRNAHMPLAPIERRFRAIRRFLHEDGWAAAVTDDNIVAFWRSDAAESALYTTIVDHFLTYEKAVIAFGSLQQLAHPDSLDGIEDWEDRLQAVALPSVDPPALADALRALGGLADGPKLLTQAEHEALAEVLSLDPYHRTRPLTALRARAFGRIQSGIANRLRRGSGGPDVAERALCTDADYAALIEGAEILSKHLRRCLIIALALRASDAPTSSLAAEGERELKRMRRAGFDAPRAELAAAIALIDGSLATAAEGLRDHCTAVAGLAKAKPLDQRLTEDRATFSAAFHTIYVEASLSGAQP
jgi:hypothetical protein